MTLLLTQSILIDEYWLVVIAQELPYGIKLELSLFKILSRDWRLLFYNCCKPPCTWSREGHMM